MKILFWFNGSGGQRRERKIFDYPHITDDNISNYASEIEEDLNFWKDCLNSSSECQRWGWTENYDAELNPLG
jgi:hypothetical protein